MPLNQDAASGSKLDRTMVPYRVLPVADEWSEPYWEGAKSHRLLIQRCESCGYYNHPPSFLCLGCKDRNAPLAFQQVTGEGAVYSWFIHHDTQVGGFEDRIPYMVIAVELIEQPGLFVVGNMLNCQYDQVEMGMQVELVWETGSEDIEILQFQPASNKIGR